MIDAQGVSYLFGVLLTARRHCTCRITAITYPWYGYDRSSTLRRCSHRRRTYPLPVRLRLCWTSCPVCAQRVLATRFPSLARRCAGHCEYGEVVSRNLAMVKVRVRFPLFARLRRRNHGSLAAYASDPLARRKQRATALWCRRTHVGVKNQRTGFNSRRCHTRYLSANKQSINGQVLAGPGSSVT